MFARIEDGFGHLEVEEGGGGEADGFDLGQGDDRLNTAASLGNLVGRGDGLGLGGIPVVHRDDLGVGVGLESGNVDFLAETGAHNSDTQGTGRGKGKGHGLQGRGTRAKDRRSHDRRSLDRRSLDRRS